MKKILAFVAAALLFAGNVFAKEVLHNLDFSIPIDKQTWTDDGDDTKFNMLGYNFDYSRVTANENNFSFIFGADIGYVKADLDDVDGLDDSFKGLDLGLKLGWGGVPVNTDKVFLAIHGFLGFDMKYLTMSSSHWGIDYENSGVYNTADKEYDDYYYALMFNTKIGVDVIFAFRFNEKIGLNAGIDLYTNLGAGTFWRDTEESNAVDFISSVGGVGIVPKIGLTIFN